MCRQWRWQGQRLARELLARIRPEFQSRHSYANRSSCWLATSHRVHFSERIRVICQKAATIEHNFDSPDGVPATCSYENRSGPLGARLGAEFTSEKQLCGP